MGRYHFRDLHWNPPPTRRALRHELREIGAAIENYEREGARLRTLARMRAVQNETREYVRRAVAVAMKEFYARGEYRVRQHITLGMTK
jgi:hypothetical protein